MLVSDSSRKRYSCGLSSQGFASSKRFALLRSAAPLPGACRLAALRFWPHSATRALPRRPHLITIHDAGRHYSLPLSANADQLIQLACDILAGRHRAGESIADPTESMRLMRLRIGDRDREVFHVFFLDTQHRIIHEETLFLGTVDGAAIMPREVVRAALLCNAATLIVGHNHPSGRVEASAADRALTQRLKDALNLVDIRLLDHIVVSRTDAASLAARGLL